MQRATDYLKAASFPAKRIGIETTFMPMDAGSALRKALPDADIKDALVVLERQRLRKSPEELAMLKASSEKVIGAMLATIAQCGPGTTKAEITETSTRKDKDTTTFVMSTAGPDGKPMNLLEITYTRM